MSGFREQKSCRRAESMRRRTGRWPDDGAAVTEYARRGAELADEAGRLEEVDLALVLAQRDLAGDKDVEVARRLSLGEEERALVCADGLEELGQALDLFVAEATEGGMPRSSAGLIPISRSWRMRVSRPWVVTVADVAGQRRARRFSGNKPSGAESN